MKKISGLILLSAIMLAGCNNKCEQPEDIRLLHLEQRVVMYYPGRLIPNTKIVDGNGGYQVFQPRTIDLNYDEWQNDGSFISARIENNEIVVQKPSDGQDRFTAVFLVTDGIGKKQLFIIWSYLMYEPSYSWYEKEWLSGDLNDYWDMENPS